MLLMKKYDACFGLFCGVIGLLSVTFTTVSAQSSIQTPAPSFIQLTAVQQFIQKMVSDHQFSENELSTWFQQINPNTKILELMDKQTENLNWHAYQKLLVTKERIQEGIAFWQKHEATLASAAQQFGIEPEILVAILGLESFYGKRNGNFSVFEALSTLAFRYPRRAAFFEKELAQYLLITREEGFDPLSVKGSYAGAMGPAQFMPSSYKQYAINFNQKGNRDILNNIPNVLGSIANYFKAHGWQSGAPVAYPAQVSGTRYKQFQQSTKPSISSANTLEQWQQYGVTLKDRPAIRDKTKAVAKLLTLEGASGQEHWVAYPNFDVIKRYNQSNHYAMAIHLLSQKIREGKTNLSKNVKKSES
jgi:membrane-bound lytic murein transglycosylase B